MSQTPPSSNRRGGHAPSDPAPVQVGQYLGSGLQFAITIALCAYGGWWVDVRWGTMPWLMIGGSLFGSVAAFYNLYRSLVRPDDTDASPVEEDDD